MVLLSSFPVVRPAKLYKQLPEGKVKCELCMRGCEISDGRKGYCKTRVNLDGELYTLVYGDISAVESRPIEIKPFFHYYPGSTALTFSTWSCNFSCPWCQNHSLSKAEPDPRRARFFSPSEIVDMALRSNDNGLCISFQEPTLLYEFALDCFKLSREKGLYNCFVSNGYMSLEALRNLKEAGLDGLKIDIKGDAQVYEKFCGGVKAEAIWRNVMEAKKLGLHLELVFLIVTEVNDDEACIEEIIHKHLKYAGPDIPIHFTRYYPAFLYRKPPTKVEILERAYEAAKKEGIMYPYIGNVHGHRYENTYCPNCGELLIVRVGYQVVDYILGEDKKCPKCGLEILIRGRYIKKPFKFL
ncbi:MAG: AmmeMemoRadiSam system radical SAM enzyme [Methanocellales archaeon]